MKKILLCLGFLCALQIHAQDLSHNLVILNPGNNAKSIPLKADEGKLISDVDIPLSIGYEIKSENNNVKTLYVTIEGKAPVSYFHYDVSISSSISTEVADFYLPGFWYHKNMRSPAEAPSFKTSSSWNVREDRLSSPLCGVYDTKGKTGLSVLRYNTNWSADALTPSMDGDVILSGESSLGYVGFDNKSGKASLTFGYPYEETPRRYIRKLTLAPSVRAFAKIRKGEKVHLQWIIRKSDDFDYGSYVANTWEYCFDRLQPKSMEAMFTPSEVKSRLSNYMREAYVGDYPLKFYSSTGILIYDCKPTKEMQLGFCGRILLNAFNAIEYGESTNDTQLYLNGQSIFDSFLSHGLSNAGYLVDFVNYGSDGIPTDVHSIRQQSEGVYATLLYLNYEKRHGRKHTEWEEQISKILDLFIAIQNDNGSYPRKYRDDGSVVDASSGSTPSATIPLVMGYRYFGKKSYLEAAKRSVDYVEKNIIATSDYFSSTLDANCEDKEAAISVSTATYYMALISKGSERKHYVDLCRRATYFALSWYYLWDVPFAQGQMLGELGFKSRGWGNVSVENNHVDVFAFEQPTIAKWLGKEVDNQRFIDMHDIISSSMCQLLPTPERLCGIGKPGFNPEVVQHTTWDYGRNGKGFYNDIFAPGWTIASLWELYTPNRTPDFLKTK